MYILAGAERSEAPNKIKNKKEFGGTPLRGFSPPQASSAFRPAVS